MAQGVLIGAWWLYLFWRPEALQLFLRPGASTPDLLAFCLPDLVVAVPASLVLLGGLIWLFLVRSAEEQNLLAEFGDLVC